MCQFEYTFVCSVVNTFKGDDATISLQSHSSTMELPVSDTESTDSSHSVSSQQFFRLSSKCMVASVWQLTLFVNDPFAPTTISSPTTCYMKYKRQFVSRLKNNMDDETGSITKVSQMFSGLKNIAHGRVFSSIRLLFAVTSSDITSP